MVPEPPDEMEEMCMFALSYYDIYLIYSKPFRCLQVYAYWIKVMLHVVLILKILLLLLIKLSKCKILLK